jgi:hypothetical protein
LFLIRQKSVGEFWLCAAGGGPMTSGFAQPSRKEIKQLAYRL